MTTPGEPARGDADALSDARAALGLRLGAGARHDSPEAPTLELDWARRGTAYFARQLAALGDDELAGPTLLAGWTRAELIAHLGYNARALTRLIDWARTGIETPMYASAQQRADEIAQGGTLPAHALRHLFDHAQAHLNVAWRDLDDAGWEAEVRTAQGRLVPAAETAWMRAREVWIHAVDLDNGGSFHDLPPLMLSRLLADVRSAWARKGVAPDLVVVCTDRGERVAMSDAIPSAATPVVTGSTADVVRWLTGRGALRLTSSTSELPPLPSWL